MSFFEGVAVMLGRAPRRPKTRTDAADILYARKRGKGREVLQLLESLSEAGQDHTWRNRRWAFLIAINMCFALSFWFDLQLFEGSLTASRVLGFHFADPYSGFLVMLADKHIAVNLVIGVVTVALMWVLLGGRGYCSWVCPYHLLAELADKFHVALASRGIVVDHVFHRGVRAVFWVIFAVMAYATGQTLFLTLNPIGIVSRALIYGPPLALAWVVVLLAFEVLYSRRAWCRYVCPIGLTYGLIGAPAPVRVVYDLERCAHEGECRKVCEVPHVLEVTIKGRAADAHTDIGPDCTRCGLCLDVCPTKSLNFEIKGLSAIL